MSQLTDNQKNILTIAASRPDGKLEPLPSNIMGGAKTATLKSLENKGVAKLVEDDWVITDRGRNAINGTPETDASLFDQPKEEEQTASITDKAPKTELSQSDNPQRSQKHPSKKSIILAMVEMPNGASLDDLCTATVWQKHSVRGSISQLKSQGNKIISKKVDSERRYFIGTNESSEEKTEESSI